MDWLRLVIAIALSGLSNLSYAAQALYWRNTLTGENYQHQLVQGQLRSQGDLPKVSMPWSLAGSGDFNADGEDDLFWRNQTTGETAIQWMKQGQHQYFADFTSVADLNWQVAVSGDLNGDGVDDLIWRHKTSGQLYLWLMGPIALKWEAPLFTVADPNWQLRFARDFDGDGKADLLFHNKMTGDNYLFLMDTATVRQQQDVQAIKDLNWQLVAAADLNGDNKTDLLWRNQITGENYGFYMAGARVTNEVALPKVADLHWQVRALTDLNGDAKADLLWWHDQTYQVVEWLMDGTKPLVELEPLTAAKNWQLQFARAIKPGYFSQPVTVPGRIEAEFYDRDGAGFGFADSDSQNQGDAKLRTDGVDIETTTDSGGGFNLGYIANGEWLNYSVKVAKTGNYKLVARVAGNAGAGQLHLEQQGNNLSGAISVAPTGGWQTWVNLESAVFPLMAGEQRLKLVFDLGLFNLNYFELVEADSPPPTTANTFWVTKQGSDSHHCLNATTDACASIQKALSLTHAGDQVLVGAGTYIESSATSPYTAPCGFFAPTIASLCINQSGTAAAPIRLSAAPGAEGLVIIDSEKQRLGLQMNSHDYIEITGLTFKNNYIIGIANYGQAENAVADPQRLSRGCFIHHNRFYATWGPWGENISAIGMWSSQDWHVANNLIDGVSSEGGTVAAGIQAYGVINALIEHNSIKNVGFGVFWKDHFIQDLATRSLWQESEIRYNRINATAAGINISIRGANSPEAGHNYIHHNLITGLAADGVGITFGYGWSRSH